MLLQSSDYSAYKVKIGGDLDADAAAIAAVAEVAGGKPLWLDANQSYRPSALKQLLGPRSATFRTLHCVEQPVPSTDTLAMQRLRGLIDLPIAIDEGSFTAAGPRPDRSHLEAADLVVVKICKSGGLRNALKTAQIALAGGLEILASGLTDCGIAFAAALHLFSQLDLALPAELNGPELLSDLYVDGLHHHQGRRHGPHRARPRRRGRRGADPRRVDRPVLHLRSRQCRPMLSRRSFLKLTGLAGLRSPALPAARPPRPGAATWSMWSSSAAGGEGLGRLQRVRRAAAGRRVGPDPDPVERLPDQARPAARERYGEPGHRHQRAAASRLTPPEAHSARSTTSSPPTPTSTSTTSTPPSAPSPPSPGRRT